MSQLLVARKVLKFNGSGGIVVQNAYHLGEDDFTIEMSFKLTETQGWGYVFSNKNDFLGHFIRLGFNQNTGQVRYYVEGADGTSSSFVTDKSFADGAWHTLTVVRHGNRGLIYVDGKLEAERGIVSGNFGNSDTYYIGNAFRGYLNNVKIFNRALTATEVYQQHGRLLNGNEPNLVGYWRVNEGEGTTVKDYTSYNRPSTMTNTAWELTTVKPIALFAYKDGKLRKVTGKIATANGLQMFYGTTEFETDFITSLGIIKRFDAADSAVATNNGLLFNTQTNFDVWQINDNLTTLIDPKPWGNAAIRAIEDYYEVTPGTSTASYGIVTDRGIGLDLLQNRDYTVSFELKSNVLQTLNYNYVISDSGNIKIANLVVNKPSEWTKFSITFMSADKDRINAGILIGADLRTDAAGNLFNIRNVKIEVGNRAT